MAVLGRAATFQLMRQAKKKNEEGKKNEKI
jgi:hypothetical protein